MKFKLSFWFAIIFITFELFISKSLSKRSKKSCKNPHHKSHSSSHSINNEIMKFDRNEFRHKLKYRLHGGHNIDKGSLSFSEESKVDIFFLKTNS